MVVVVGYWFQRWSFLFPRLCGKLFVSGFIRLGLMLARYIKSVISYINYLGGLDGDFILGRGQA